METSSSLITFHILGLFPKMFEGYLLSSILGKAHEAGFYKYHIWNLADFSVRPTRRVDDRPFGGGSGTILSPEPIHHAIQKIESEYGPVTEKIVFTPRGATLNQNQLESRVQAGASYLLLCGRYEGIDERILEHHNFTQLSLGSFVLTGGELPTLVFMDGIIRLIPGVIDIESLHEESFSSGLDGKIEYPQYTRPQNFLGRVVPSELISGDHKKIALWKTSHLQ